MVDETEMNSANTVVWDTGPSRARRRRVRHREFGALRHLGDNADISNLTMAQSTADDCQQDYALAIYALALQFQV